MKLAVFASLVLTVGASSPTDVVHYTVPPTEKGFWTAERLASAVEIPLPELTAEQFQEVLARVGNMTEFASKPGSMEGSEAFPIDGELLAEKAVAVSNPTSSPYNAVAKLFFSMGSGQAVCSASQIMPGVVLTAGHCVHGGRGGSSGWYSNFQLYPAYPSAGRQQSITGIVCFNGWTDSGAFEYDFCMGRITGTSYGSSTGFTWHQGMAQTFRALGYPAASPYNGNQMYMATASSTSNSGSPTYGIVGMRPNVMTGGCSGGPWWVSSGNANGVNSFKYTNDDSTMYSPYFGDGPQILYNAL